MDTRVRMASLGAVLVLLATLVAMPGIAAASGTGAASSWHHGSGTLHWRADQVSYVYRDGTRYAARGHGWVGEDDCWGWGMDGMRITVRFQRLVDGRWITTQTASKRMGWSNSGRMMDDHHARGFTPTFQLRSGDMHHQTRMHYDFGWYDGQKKLAGRHANRYH